MMNKDIYIYITYIHIYIYFIYMWNNGILLGYKNEIMPFPAMWMDLEIITVSKISQEDKYNMISLIRGI